MTTENVKTLLGKLVAGKKEQGPAELTALVNGPLAEEKPAKKKKASTKKKPAAKPKAKAKPKAESKPKAEPKAPAGYDEKLKELIVACVTAEPHSSYWQIQAFAAKKMGKAFKAMESKAQFKEVRRTMRAMARDGELSRETAYLYSTPVMK